MNKVPKLRFKEFSGEWEEKRLEEIFEISKTKYNPLKETKEYPCIELESLSQETGKILKTFNSLEQKSIKNKFLKNEVLFGKLRPYLKKYWYSNFEGVCSSEIWVLNSKNNINKFIYYFIQGENFISLANTTSGTKMPRADWSLMKNEIFSIPNIQEQEKIADFLYSVDKKISITEEKLDLFKEYKKGIMQKIFNQKLRFKDSNGNDYPEWKEKKLGEVFKEISERNLEENSELLSVSLSNGVQKRSEIDIKDNSSEDKSKYKKVEKLDIVYNTMRMWQGAVGVSYYNGIVSPAYTIIRLKENNIIEYFKYLFKTQNMIYLFKKFSQGLTSDTWNLKFDKFKEISIQLPCLEEQQKIANFLSSIDKKIDNLAAELENLKEFKKGLLQQMFV